MTKFVKDHFVPESFDFKHPDCVQQKEAGSTGKNLLTYSRKRSSVVLLLLSHSWKLRQPQLGMLSRTKRKEAMDIGQCTNGAAQDLSIDVF